MPHAYQIISSNPDDGTFVLEFEGKEALNFNIPFLDGAFLVEADLETAIQQLYPYTDEEFIAAKQLAMSVEIDPS